MALLLALPLGNAHARGKLISNEKMPPRDGVQVNYAKATVVTHQGPSLPTYLFE